MSRKLTIQQVQERLPELLDQVAKNGEEYVVQRHGTDCAVIVNARQWRRRTAGQRLDALGADYRLTRAKQLRAEKLLLAKERRALTALEQRDLKKLLRECDAILLRRAAALERQR